jgi:glutamine cyclotransferase
LEFYNDTLYESTGQKGNSYFKKFDYKTGLIFNKINLNPDYFGEGVTIINGKIFQLTWQEKTGFIYDTKTLKLEKKFTYDKTVEGWGMTNDGDYIYHSDGTEKIWKMNPDNQKLIDFINVYSGTSKIEKINELEWIEGKIYSNIWQKNAIAIINPLTGEVEAILNMTDLTKLIPNYDPENNVLNGIAYNPKRKTIFVTGKNWDKIFEITISK